MFLKLAKKQLQIWQHNGSLSILQFHVWNMRRSFNMKTVEIVWKIIITVGVKMLPMLHRTTTLAFSCQQKHFSAHFTLFLSRNSVRFYSSRSMYVLIRIRKNLYFSISIWSKTRFHVFILPEKRVVHEGFYICQWKHEIILFSQ